MCGQECFWLYSALWSPASKALLCFLLSHLPQLGWVKHAVAYMFGLSVSSLCWKKQLTVSELRLKNQDIQYCTGFTTIFQIFQDSSFSSFILEMQDTSYHGSGRCTWGWGSSFMKSASPLYSKMFRKAWLPHSILYSHLKIGFSFPTFCTQ